MLTIILKRDAEEQKMWCGNMTNATEVVWTNGCKPTFWPSIFGEIVDGRLFSLVFVQLI